MEDFWEFQRRAVSKRTDLILLHDTAIKILPLMILGNLI